MKERDRKQGRMEKQGKRVQHIKGKEKEICKI